MLFGKKKNISINRKLLIDIKSSSVYVALVDVSKNTPHIDFVTKESLKNFDPERNNVDYLVISVGNLVDRNIKKALDYGISNLSKKNQSLKIEEVFVTYGSPWNKISTKDVKIREDRPFVLTRQKFDYLVKKQIKKEQENNPNQKLLEKDVVSISLNGYETNNPFNKKAKEIVLSFYMSFISQKMMRAVEHKIFYHLHEIKITHRTFFIVMLSSIKNIFSKEDNFVFFDISGEITDFGIVEKGAFSYLSSIPVGINYFVRNAAKICKIEKTTSSSLLNMLAKEEIHQSCPKNIYEELKKFEKEWVNKVHEAIQIHINSSENNKLNIPPKVILLVDDKGTEIFSRILKSSFAKRNIFETENKIQVIELTVDKFKDFIVKNKERSHSISPYTTLSSIFLINN
jgi:cell division ATPase FtsA